jgi:uncharacterized protein with NRDE domain
MCLAAIAVARHPRWAWVLASNRDEFFHRAAAPLAWWQPIPGGPPLLGGRDLHAGGTWLGLTAAGRLALVTNVREPGQAVPGAASRGELVPRWLVGPDDDEKDGQDEGRLAALAAEPRNGCNFIAADLRAGGGAWWFSNRPQPRHCRLGAGLYGLSNAALDTPWPKVVLLKQRLEAALAAHSSLPGLIEATFHALSDRTLAPDEALPATGIPLQRERQLSPACIRIPGPRGQAYGTRCSTVVVVEAVGAVRTAHVVERSFSDSGEPSGEVAVRLDLPS